ADTPTARGAARPSTFATATAVASNGAPHHGGAASIFFTRQISRANERTTRVMALPRPTAGKLFTPIIALLAWSASLAQTGVFTYHNDVGRTGQNTSEHILTPASVRSSSFQKLVTYNVDADVYAQPLYVPRLAIAGKGGRNVVLIATEADSVYAFDADGGTDPASDLLWHSNLLDTAHGGDPTATPVSAVELGCPAISPQVGITSTPVVDPLRKTLYVETFSKQRGTL